MKKGFERVFARNSISTGSKECCQLVITLLYISM